MREGCHICLLLGKERTLALLSLTSVGLLGKHCQNPQGMCASYQVKDFRCVEQGYFCAIWHRF
jgi:hypothetical protein